MASGGAPAPQLAGALPAGMTLEAPAYAGAPAIPMLGNGATAPALSAGTGSTGATPGGLQAYLQSVQSKVPTAAQLNALTPSNPVATEMAAEQQAAQQAAAAQAAAAAVAPVPPAAGTPAWMAANGFAGQKRGGPTKGYADGGMMDQEGDDTSPDVGMTAQQPGAPRMADPITYQGQQQVSGVPIAASTPTPADHQIAMPGLGQEMMDIGAGIMGGRSPYAFGEYRPGHLGRVAVVRVREAGGRAAFGADGSGAGAVAGADRVRQAADRGGATAGREHGG